MTAGKPTTPRSSRSRISHSPARCEDARHRREDACRGGVCCRGIDRRELRSASARPATMRWGGAGGTRGRAPGGRGVSVEEQAGQTAQGQRVQGERGGGLAHRESGRARRRGEDVEGGHGAVEKDVAGDLQTAFQDLIAACAAGLMGTRDARSKKGVPVGRSRKGVCSSRLL
jgi:hypothetical protein